MRVAVAQSFSIETARRLVALGEYPAHQLWGADHLERLGWEVEYIAGSTNARMAARLGRYSDVLGGVEQQLAVIKQRRRGGVTLAGRAQVTRGLAIARSSRAWRHPLVSVFHNPVSRAGGIGTAWVRGVDLALCLTPMTHRSLLAHGRDPERTLYAPWGPDLRFPGYSSTGETQIVSTGKDNRDLPTLLEALRSVDFEACVYSTSGCELPNVRTPTPPATGHFTYVDVLAELQKAAIVAIPIDDPDRLTGLTEVNDALALGKPIVMTRTPHFGDELEAAGCAILVEQGDARGWAETLNRLLEDSELRHEMGAAARRFAEQEWNYASFCSTLEHALSLANLRAG